MIQQRCYPISKDGYRHLHRLSQQLHDQTQRRSRRFFLRDLPSRPSSPTSRQYRSNWLTTGFSRSGKKSPPKSTQDIVQRSDNPKHGQSVQNASNESYRLPCEIGVFVNILWKRHTLGPWINFDCLKLTWLLGAPRPRS